MRCFRPGELTIPGHIGDPRPELRRCIFTSVTWGVDPPIRVTDDGEGCPSGWWRTRRTTEAPTDAEAPMPPTDRKTELLRWLSEEGRFAADGGRLLEALCERLAALGVPIVRATTHVRTLHPEFRGVARIWRRGERTEIRTPRRGIEFTSDYENSPIQYVVKTGQWLDAALDETTDRQFPILATLRE